MSDHRIITLVSADADLNRIKMPWCKVKVFLRKALLASIQPYSSPTP